MIALVFNVSNSQRIFHAAGVLLITVGEHLAAIRREVPQSRLKPQAKLKELKNSRSWKLTAPLRKCAEVAKGILKRRIPR